MKFARLMIAASAALALLAAGTVHAELYKYQDKNGKWHFSDKPPADAAGKSTVVKSSGGAGNQRNYAQELEDHFKPVTDVDRATLAVVTVKTAAGSGSGFFVTDDGYLVTNRHVVRPTTSSSAKEAKSELEERERELDDYRLRLKHERERLKEARATIDERREYAESTAATASYKAQYKRYVERYQRDKKYYEEQLKKFREIERDFKKVKSDFSFASNMSNFSKKFTVTFKNGKSAKARLIRISKDHDLALLKLDKGITPYLQLTSNRVPRQGMEVFAIGSPLGISDALTTGIVTKSASDFLFTDTRILPGNSGGPLIDSSGSVLGVNTAVLTGQAVPGGLGVAIYAQHIRDEFARDLKGKF